MRRLFVLLIILLNIIFCSSNATINIEQNFNIKNNQTFKAATSQNYINIDFKNYENAILQQNQNPNEIFSRLNKFDDDNSYSFYSKYNKYKYNYQKFICLNICEFLKYNIFLDYYLAYEVYTRAP